MRRLFFEQRYNLPKDLGFSLMLIRTRYGYSQRALAAKIGTSQAAIARFEAGKTWPAVRTLQKIADVYGARIKITFELPEQVA